MVKRYDVAVDVAAATVTHGLLFATDTQGVCWIIDEWRHDGSVDGQMEEREQVAAMVKRWDTYNVKCWIIDPSADNFQYILKSQFGQVAIHGINNVEEGIHTVKMWINDGKLRISHKSCPALVREGGSYQWDEKAADRNQDKPIKGNDHGMDAMRYGVNTMARVRPSIRRMTYRRAG